MSTPGGRRSPRDSPGLSPGRTDVSPAVVFADARRPETATIVQLPPFDGPLGLLLALIEARQLDVLTVPLGALAEAYLDALATLEADRLGNVSAFVSIASQLILIKSRAMLPRQEVLPPSGLPDEGVDPEAELRARLIRYREYRNAGARLQALALSRFGLFRRDGSAALSAALAGARPTDVPPIDPIVLLGALNGLVRIAPPIHLRPRSSRAPSRSPSRRPSSARRFARPSSGGRAGSSSRNSSAGSATGWLSR